MEIINKINIKHNFVINKEIYKLIIKFKLKKNDLSFIIIILKAKIIKEMNIK